MKMYEKGWKVVETKTELVEGKEIKTRHMLARVFVVKDAAKTLYEMAKAEGRDVELVTVKGRKPLMLGNLELQT